MPSQTTGAGGIVFFWSSIRPSGLCPSFHTYFARRDISLLTGRISLKLDTNIHHVSGRSGKGFWVRGQRSRSFLIILFELYCYSSHSYSQEGAISCVQMCECYNGETCISTMWGRCSLVFVIFSFDLSSRSICRIDVSLHVRLPQYTLCLHGSQRS